MTVVRDPLEWWQFIYYATRYNFKRFILWPGLFKRMELYDLNFREYRRAFGYDVEVEKK